MNKKLLSALGVVAVAKISHAFSGWVRGSSLGRFAPRRNTALSTVTYVGLGALLGAGAALLLAPADGKSTRQRLGLQLQRAKATSVTLMEAVEPKAENNRANGTTLSVEAQHEHPPNV